VEREDKTLCLAGFLRVFLNDVKEAKKTLERIKPPQDSSQEAKIYHVNEDKKLADFNLNFISIDEILLILQDLKPICAPRKTPPPPAKEKEFCLLGYVRVHVSNVEKAVEILKKMNINPDSPKEMKIYLVNREKNFIDFDPSLIPIDELISIFRNLKPICAQATTYVIPISIGEE
jgi:hypothetical protein